MWVVSAVSVDVVSFLAATLVVSDSRELSRFFFCFFFFNFIGDGGKDMPDEPFTVVDASGSFAFLPSL